MPESSGAASDTPETQWNKNLRTTASKGLKEEFHFTCIIPYSTAQHQGGTPWPKTVSLTGKRSNQHPKLLVPLHKRPFWFHPMHWANVRPLGTARNTKDRQVLPVSPMWRVLPCSQWPALEKDSIGFFHLANNSQHSCQGLPTGFPAEGPTCSCISRLWLPESISISTHHTNQSLWSAPAWGSYRTTLPAASPGLCGCVHAQCQVTVRIPSTSLTEEDTVNAKTFQVHELEGLILLKCPVYPKWSESVQSLSKFQ